MLHTGVLDVGQEPLTVQQGPLQLRFPLILKYYMRVMGQPVFASLLLLPVFVWLLLNILVI